MSPEKAALLRLHLVGYVHVALHVMGAAVIVFWVLQGVALSIGAPLDGAPFLSHLILSMMFLAVFPGQSFWTYTLEDAKGQAHVIIGVSHSDHPRR